MGALEDNSPCGAAQSMVNKALDESKIFKEVQLEVCTTFKTAFENFEKVWCDDALSSIADLVAGLLFTIILSMFACCCTARLVRTASTFWGQDDPTEHSIEMQQDVGIQRVEEPNSDKISHFMYHQRPVR